MKVLFVFIYKIFLFFEKIYNYSKNIYQYSLFKSIGEDVTIAPLCYFTYSKITIGNDVNIGMGCHFSSTVSEIVIGNHVMFGPNVSIHGGNHTYNKIGRYMKSIRLDEKDTKDDENIYIDDDTWIGDGVVILKGVHIGKGSIIGAGCIIPFDIEPYSIVTGSMPFKIRRRFNEHEIELHEKTLNLYK